MKIREIDSVIFDIGDLVVSFNGIHLVLAYDEIDFGFFKDSVFVVIDLEKDSIKIFKSDIDFFTKYPVLRVFNKEESDELIERFCDEFGRK